MVWLIAEASPYVAAGFGLAGTLIGGIVAGTVSLRVARETKESAETRWIRDNRRDAYDRLLTHAQTLLIACEDARDGPHRSEQFAVHLQQAFVDFFSAYGVVQTIAERPVVVAVRVYGYRLLELKEMLSSRGTFASDRFDEVAQLVRRARHHAIDAMRHDYGLSDSVRPPEDFNPFDGTDLAGEYNQRRYRSSGATASAMRTSGGLPRSG